LFGCKLAFEFLFQTLGLFLPKVRRRWVETAALLGWMSCLQPRSWGLSMGIERKWITLRDGTRVLEEHAAEFNDFDSKRRQTKVLKDLNWKRTLEYNAGERTFYIKIYKAPTWQRRLKFFFFGSRAHHELTMSRGVYQRGIPQAPVVAMREGGQENWVAIEKLSDWSQLQATILAAPDRRRLCRRYGRFARRIHDAGISQYDFNPTNVLVKGDEFKLIDFELMRLHPCAPPEEKRLHSLGKMNRIAGISRTDRLRFLVGYLESVAQERRDWKRIARRILELHVTQVDHDLDRSERRCLDENRDYGAFEAGEWRGYYLKKRAERPGGLTIDEAKALAVGEAPACRVEAAADPIAEWQKANRKAKEGGPAPLAVLYRASPKEGKIAFPRAPEAPRS
jgi:tRNA A-37 threonylcarbamoyl transferase component Bud32